jgi:hypothetical protein
MEFRSLRGETQSSRAPHGAAIVLIGSSANQANLIVLAVNAVGPGKPVGAKFREQEIEEGMRHWLLPFALSWAPFFRPMPLTVKQQPFSGALARH